MEALPVVDVEGGVLLRSSRHGHLGQIEREGIQGMQVGDVSHQAVTDCLPGGRVESAEIVGARHALGGDEASLLVDAVDRRDGDAGGAERRVDLRLPTRVAVNLQGVACLANDHGHVLTVTSDVDVPTRSGTGDHGGHRHHVAAQQFTKPASQEPHELRIVGSGE